MKIDFCSGYNKSTTFNRTKISFLKRGSNSLFFAVTIDIFEKKICAIKNFCFFPLFLIIDDCVPRPNCKYTFTTRKLNKVR